MEVAVMCADIKDLNLKIKAMQERLSILSVLHQECSSANSGKGFSGRLGTHDAFIGPASKDPCRDNKGSL